MSPTISSRQLATSSELPAPKVGVVYSVSTGGYDLEKSSQAKQDNAMKSGGVSRQHLQTLRKPGIDFFFFCDMQSCAQARQLHPSATSIFTVVPIEEATSLGNLYSNVSARMSSASKLQRMSRFVKILPHRIPLLAGYRVSLYIDANVLPSGSPLMPLLKQFDPSQGGTVDLGFYDFQRSLEHEGEHVGAILAKTRDGRAYLRSSSLMNFSVRDQIQEYQAAFNTTLQPVPADYSASTNYGKVIVRANNDRTKFFNERWWQEFCRGVPRDQLSYKYSMRVAELQVGLRALRLNEGMGARLCKCAADTRGFQRFFRHQGRFTSKLGNR